MNDTKTLWEDTDSIELPTKSENKLMFVPNDGISGINNAFVTNECKDTGNKKEWTRPCPRCHKNIQYKTKRTLNRASTQNRLCFSCTVTKNNRTKENYVGDKFGGLTIINQYYPSSGALKVDYKCNCGNVTFGKTFSKVKTQRMCEKCRRTNAHKIKPNTAFNMLFGDYKRNAIKRTLEFQLSREKFQELIKGHCFYCGDAPVSVRRPSAKGEKYVYNGIDRKDNLLGYTNENCVSCCKKCNFAKYDMNIDDFIGHIKKIYERWR